MDFLLILLSAIFKIANAIFGGTIASEGSFKYQVSIWEEHLPICSGAVLDKWRILTAAACVATYPTEHYIVHAGSIIQRERNSPYYEVEQIHLHPDYNGEDDDNETELRQPLPLGENVQSVSLPTEENLPYCSFCKVAGWGLTDEVLKWTFQAIYTPNMCLRQDSAHRQNEFCAVDPSEFSNPDDGDEGSPLICDGTAIGIYIPSRVDRGYPVIYAKIFSFLAFINSIRKDILSEAPEPSAVNALRQKN